MRLTVSAPSRAPERATCSGTRTMWRRIGTRMCWWRASGSGGCVVRACNHHAFLDSRCSRTLCPVVLPTHIHQPKNTPTRHILGHTNNRTQLDWVVACWRTTEIRHDMLPVAKRRHTHKIRTHRSTGKNESSSNTFPAASRRTPLPPLAILEISRQFMTNWPSGFTRGCFPFGAFDCRIDTCFCSACE
jgi:hypothetical protein